MEEGFFRPLTVGVIGGRGRMGRLLVRLLQEAGQEVLVLDRKDGPWEPKLARRCLVLVLAVPLSAVEEVMRAVGPYTRADGAVIDVASLKEEPLRAMLAHARGEVVGSHPLFGPLADPAGQTVFLCPGRGRAWAAWWRCLWRRVGARVVEISPSRHDSLMARVQTLRHLLVAVLGLALVEMDFDPHTDLALAGPWFGRLWELLDNQGAQPAELYAELALANSQGTEAARALARAAGRLHVSLAQRDRQGVAALLDQAVQLVTAGQTGQAVDRARNLG